MVVYTDERATESENFAEGDEYGVVNLAERMRDEPTREQCAPESAHCSSDDELKAFHLIMNFELRITRLPSPRRLLPKHTYARCCVRFGS